MGFSTFPSGLFSATVAELMAIHIAELQLGARCYVLDQDQNFYLVENPALIPNGTTIVRSVPGAIVGKPGALWATENEIAPPPPPASSTPTEIAGISGTQQTAQTGPDTKGAIVFDPSTLPSLGRSIVFEAVLECSTVDQTCSLELFNLTDGLSVVTLTTPSTVSAVVTSGALAVPGSLPNSKKLYTLRMTRTGGTSSDLVACQSAKLRVAYS